MIKCIAANSVIMYFCVSVIRPSACNSLVIHSTPGNFSRRVFCTSSVVVEARSRKPREDQEDF